MIITSGQLQDIILEEATRINPPIKTATQAMFLIESTQRIMRIIQEEIMSDRKSPERVYYKGISDIKFKRIYCKGVGDNNGFYEVVVPKGTKRL